MASTGMNGDLCLDCLTYKPHPNGRCWHDPYAPCPKCGQSMGWLTAEMDPKGPCRWCLSGDPRVAVPQYDPLPEWEFDL